MGRRAVPVSAKRLPVPAPVPACSVGSKALFLNLESPVFACADAGLARASLRSGLASVQRRGLFGIGAIWRASTRKPGSIRRDDATLNKTCTKPGNGAMLGLEVGSASSERWRRRRFASTYRETPRKRPEILYMYMTLISRTPGPGPGRAKGGSPLAGPESAPCARQPFEKAQNGNGSLLQEVGMDATSAPRRLGAAGVSAWRRLGAAGRTGDDARCAHQGDMTPLRSAQRLRPLPVIPVTMLCYPSSPVTPSTSARGVTPLRSMHARQLQSLKKPSQRIEKARF